MSGWAEGIPGDVEPVGAGKKLVCIGIRLEEIHKILEFSRVDWTDVSGLAKEVLRLSDSAHQAVHPLASES